MILLHSAIVVSAEVDWHGIMNIEVNTGESTVDAVFSNFHTIDQKNNVLKMGPLN